MLRIQNIEVHIQEKPILYDISLHIVPGTRHAIMGPNGSGKSSLAYALIGHPLYKVTKGTIILDGADITTLSTDKRAHNGLFLTFQQPPVLAGVRVIQFLHAAYKAVVDKDCSLPHFIDIADLTMGLLKINKSFMERNLNEGFSGGEKKLFEMLQLLLLKPKVAILDEIDSGLDVDALRAVARGLEYACGSNPSLSLMIITHYKRILDYIAPNHVHVLCDGRIVASDGSDLLNDIESKGYDAYKQRSN